MTADHSSAMEPGEIYAFLDRGGTGVLSLAAENVPYATPVSYGFDPDAETLYFRLGFTGDDGEKRHFLEASELARFVTYGRRDGTWTSVVAVGPLERVDADAVTREVATALQAADLPLLDAWDDPPDAVEFAVYRLAAEDLTGRRGRPDDAA